MTQILLILLQLELILPILQEQVQIHNNLEQTDQTLTQIMEQLIIIEQIQPITQAEEED